MPTEIILVSSARVYAGMLAQISPVIPAETRPGIPYGIHPGLPGSGRK